MVPDDPPLKARIGPPNGSEVQRGHIGLDTRKWNLEWIVAKPDAMQEIDQNRNYVRFAGHSPGTLLIRQGRFGLLPFRQDLGEDCTEFVTLLFRRHTEANKRLNTRPKDKHDYVGPF